MVPSGCDTPELKSLKPPPPLASLQLISTIRRTDEALAVSGIASSSNCDLLLVGARWGTLTRIRANGIEDVGNWQLPGAHSMARLESGSEDNIIVWSSEPGFLGFFSADDMDVVQFPIPEHHWGGRRVGPVVALSHTRVVMAPIGDSPPLREPQPWVTTPLLEVVDQQLGLVGVIDTVARQHGTYLSWRLSRVGLGRTADTIVALDLSSATLTVYEPALPEAAVQTLWAIQLPQYFVAPVPRAEIWTPDWIQVGGEVQVFLDVPHVAAVAFGNDGRVYAVRNYHAEWRRSRNDYTSSQGSWWVVRRGLEIYDLRGKLLGAYSLPGQDPAWRANGWLRVDRHGRIFLPDGAGSVLIFQNPTVERDKCPTLPPIIELTTKDTPPT
jgi:hypothetical protein